jgi:hypothetical protein
VSWEDMRRGSRGRGRDGNERELVFVVCRPRSTRPTMRLGTGILASATRRMAPLQPAEPSSWFPVRWFNRLPLPVEPSAPIPAAPQPVTHSSRLPGVPAAFEFRPLRSYESKRRTFAPPPPSPSPRLAPPALSPVQLRSRLIQYLRSRQPRRALHAFLTSLDSSSPPKPYEITRSLSLFHLYSHPELALEAASKMDAKGFQVPAEISNKILASREVMDELVLDPLKLSRVVGWMEESIKAGGVDEQIVMTVMKVLRRVGRRDWALNVLEAYCAALPKGEVGSPAVWASLIRTEAEDDHVEASQRIFYLWRSLYRASQRKLDAGQLDASPPEAPYLALLDVLSDSSASPPGGRPRGTPSPGHGFLQVLERDSLETTPFLLTSLLRLELSERRFTSFWTLITKMDALEIRKSKIVWRLISKALLWQSKDLTPTRRYKSPTAPSFISRRPISVASQRRVLQTFLSQHLSETPNPNSAIPISHHPILDLSTLNAFLRLFVQLSDWPTCALLLTVFKTNLLEPDEHTHGILVLGIVSIYSRGTLPPLAEGIVGAGDPLKMMQAILEKRAMRINLWTEGSLKREGNVPGWMKRREMRDTKYLGELLRRCEGCSEEEWEVMLREVGELVLPIRECEQGEE